MLTPDDRDRPRQRAPKLPKQRRPQAVEYRWAKDQDVLSLTLVTDVGDPVVGFVMEHDTKVAD